mgnify:CR=1 FL=1
MSLARISGRTTNSETEFQKFNLSSESLIYIDKDRSSIEFFSIELTLGDGWSNSYSNYNKNLWEVKDGDGVNLNAQDSIVVEVQEDIKVPHNKYGVVLPTGSLFLSHGVMVASAKVEPAFQGKLKLRIFNTTRQKVFLTKGHKLGSLIFFNTDSTKEHETTYRKSDISILKKSKIKELGTWFSENKVVWLGWIFSSLTSSLLAFALTYNFYYKDVISQKEGNGTSNPKHTTGLNVSEQGVKK